MSMSVQNGLTTEQRSTSPAGPANAEVGGNGARTWSVAESARTYGITSWGQGYFSLNNEGNVQVHPTQDPAKSIDLKKLVDELRERDIALPILVRFTDILRHRV